MDSLLQSAFNFYLAHQDAIAEKYDGKYIVIKDGEVLGAYDNELVAVMETQKSHKLGTFLVQKGNAVFSPIFHSRVAFL